MFARIDYTAESRKIHLGKCGLISITVSGDGADADAQIYDGEDTVGRQVLHVEAKSGTTAHIVFGEDAFLEKGLYVVVNASTTKVSIQYRPIR